MGLYWDQIFNTAGESTSLAAMNNGTGAAVGPYRPKASGRILKILLMVGQEAATSLVEDVRVEITCTAWNPNTLMFGAAGDGLHTAPASGAGGRNLLFDIDQPVKTDVDITANYIHDSGAPVTSRLRVFALFQV